jgi:hypothetical protein
MIDAGSLRLRNTSSHDLHLLWQGYLTLETGKVGRDVAYFWVENKMILA